MKSIRLHVIAGNHLQCDVIFNSFVIINVTAIAVIDMIVVVVAAAAAVFILRRSTK
jgi:hypothetical protein